MSSSFPLGLNRALDLAHLTEQYARNGRVVVDQVLAPETASALHLMLRTREDWSQVVGGETQLVELDRATRAGLTAEQAAALDDAVHAGARYGFQYRFETIRVPDGAEERRRSDDPLATFAAWWSGGEPLAMLRAITGDDTAAFADAQATAYAPGDLLTGHDDEVAGKGRVAAYVLGLTPQWRLEWGGLLMFHDERGTRAEAWMPGFNSLALFRVPQPHSVSQVSRAAAFRRYSITGWLRRGRPHPA